MTAPRRPRCAQPIHWWDCNLTARCILHAGHTGPHSDGLRWFDSFGLQVPQSPQVVHSNRGGHHDITPADQQRAPQEVA